LERKGRLLKSLNGSVLSQDTKLTGIVERGIFWVVFWSIYNKCVVVSPWQCFNRNRELKRDFTTLLGVEGYPVSRCRTPLTQCLRYLIDENINPSSLITLVNNDDVDFYCFTRKSL
jgi:hypothetical protein